MSERRREKNPSLRQSWPSPSSKLHKAFRLCVHTGIMIRIKSLPCNINTINYSLDSSFTYTIYPDISTQKCPACGTCGWFKPYSSYTRYVVDWVGGEPVTYQITILRVKCECGHTHALLKDSLVPYCQYSLGFMAQVLKTYFRKNCTIEQICKKFLITPPTLYRFVKLYQTHRLVFLGLLLSTESNPLWFLRYIEHLPIPSDFLESFYLKTTFSFLQSHANPAYS